MPLIPRSLTPYLSRLLTQFPAILLTGPRQAGKTTLLRQLGDAKYVAMDLPDIRAAAANDPRGFLTAHPPPVIFDEVQNTPQLLHYLRAAIDERRDQSGQWMLSGSQNLLLMEQVGETLAGRVAVVHLFPLTQRELDADPARPLPWERTAHPAPTSASQLWERIVRGWQPELHQKPVMDAQAWLSGYVQTYLERDVRSLRQVGDLTQFQTFLRTVAGRTAQLLSLSELSRDLGVAVNTIKAWISVLETSHLVIQLRPWVDNPGKRLVKAPKLYFLDTGLVCYLTGIRTAEQARLGPMAGALAETFVVSEVYKTLWHRAEEPRLYFWRTSAGQEVDLIVDSPTGPIPVEVKATATPLPRMAQGIRAFQKDHPTATPGWLIHTGDTVLPLGGATAISATTL